MDFSKHHILVVGDIILDEFLKGAVDRISPEAPVPVMRAAQSEYALGGSANVAHNLASLGARVSLAGVVGDDAMGAQLRATCRAKNIDVNGILSDPTRPTTHKLRVVAQGQQMMRIDRELSTTISPELALKFRAYFEEILPAVDIVICSDYAKGVVPAVAADLFAAAKRAGKRVVVDPKGYDYSRYAGAFLISPNLHELGVAVGWKIQNASDRDRAAAQIMNQIHLPALLVTCGAQGMVLYEQNNKPAHIPATAREVFDVTGAGDTAIAVMAVALCAGRSTLEAARLANFAAGVVVGKRGTAVLRPDELTTDSHSTQKIVDRDVLKERVQKLRAEGKRIVFTNGCFDILHAGHVTYLEAAARCGDVLIVGLNSDASVKRLKGPTRPIVAERYRAVAMAALECVGLVCLFDEDTPASIITEVQPDVLVKGADYKPSDVVGRDMVEARGGRLELIPLVQGLSTSAIVDAIRKSDAAES